MSFDLLSLFENVNRVGITGHVRPDGDCVGSTLAMYNYIQKKYPTLDLHIFLEEIPSCFSFLKNADRIETPGVEQDPFDLFIILDCGDLSRIGKSDLYFHSAKKTLCIDHHLSNATFCNENYVFPEASSTCELVFDLLAKDDISKDIAECIYTGIVTDTGLFQYSCTHHSTMECAGFLMDLGIDYPVIVDTVFNEKTFVQNQILGQALINARLSENKTLVSSILTSQELEKYGAASNDMEGIVSQLRVTKGAQASLFLHQNPDGSYKGSLRAKGHILNVAEIASHYQGGGHAMAAGFRVNVDQDPNQVIDDISRMIDEQLREGGFFK